MEPTLILKDHEHHLEIFEKGSKFKLKIRGLNNTQIFKSLTDAVAFCLGFMGKFDNNE